MKTKLGDVALAEPVTHLIADVRARRCKAFHRLLGFLLVAIHGDIDARGLPTWIQYNFCDVAKPNALVRKLAFEDGSNLVFYRFHHPVSMMAGSASFRHGFLLV